MKKCINCGRGQTTLFEGKYCSIDCADEWDDDEVS